MKKDVIAIFDIGKTNKKFFLFDRDLKEVHKEHISFKKIKDEDGHPSENLSQLVDWVKATIADICNSPEYDVKAMNFSAYGASFVHLDEHGKPATTFYDYTKSIDRETKNAFYGLFGERIPFKTQKPSTDTGMLHSGIQLFWLKHKKPEIYGKIWSSLYLPQYLSFIFTGIPISELTSMGCHTALWDADNNDYFPWVHREGIGKKLPPLVSADSSEEISLHGKKIRVGPGIHDTSAALLPFLKSSAHPFILLSTGTWCVTLNPYVKDSRHYGRNSGCIHYLQPNGDPILASRLFLGQEHQIQVLELGKMFHKPKGHYKKIAFDRMIWADIMNGFRPMFKWKAMTSHNTLAQTELKHTSYTYAYHQLMIELVLLQVASIQLVTQEANPKVMYVTGGFSNNPIFLELLSLHMDLQVKTVAYGSCSALGAAMAISNDIFHERKTSSSTKENHSP